MKRDPSPLVDLSVFQGGAVRPIGRGGIPPASAYSRIRVANLGARSEGALFFLNICVYTVCVSSILVSI